MKGDYNFSQYFQALSLYSVSIGDFLKPPDGLKPSRLGRALRYKLDRYIENPYYFNLQGLLTFHGSQGFGKTLTAAAVYCHQVLDRYPYCILCTNTKFKDRPFNAYIHISDYSDAELHQMYDDVKEDRRISFIDSLKREFEKDFLKLDYPEFTVDEYVSKCLSFHCFNEASDFEDFCFEVKYQLRDIVSDEVITSEKILDGTFKKVTVEYWGLDCLKFISNGHYGVLYFIDEIQLELNSLERNIPLEVMIEISQQRKQNKHIVATSQRIKRISKFLREQIHDCVDCRCFFGLIQYNKFIDGESITESASGNKLTYRTRKRSLFFHDVDLYEYYDTYAKMKRYKNEWTGKPSLIVDNAQR